VFQRPRAGDWLGRVAAEGDLVTHTKHHYTNMTTQTSLHKHHYTNIITQTSLHKHPIRPKSLEMAHEPRGVCFKLELKKSCSCFLHSPRSHIGDVLWNSEPDSRRQFSHCFWSAFLVFRKMRFRTESCKTYHPKHTTEGSSFWPYGYTN